LFFQRGQIFQIKSIDSLVNPPLYKLIDLLKDDVRGQYYESQLKPAQNPEDTDYWKIEKVLKTRKKNGKTEHFVKFLHYPRMYFLFLLNLPTPKTPNISAFMNFIHFL